MNPPVRGNGRARAVEEFAVPVHPISPDLAVPLVAGILSDEPLLPGVVVRDPAGRLHLISRATVQARVTGRLGYGPALTARMRIAALLGGNTMLVESSVDAVAAADAALARPPADRDNDVLVRWPNDRVGIAPVTSLLNYLAQHHAHLARHDPLTGLGNRQGLIEALGSALRPGRPPVAVQLIDLDRFDAINEALGHDAGDTVLCAVAEALCHTAGGRATVYRITADIFAMVTPPAGAVPDTTERPAIAAADTATAMAAADTATAMAAADTATAMAEMAVLAVRGPFPVAGIPVSVEAHVGIAVGPSHGDHPETLLRRATAAVQAAKRNRSAVEIWNPSWEHARREDLALLTELRAAIDAGQLCLHYQPLIAATSRRMHGVEALVRWQHPYRGLIPPAGFVPQAEQSDIIVALSDWVLAEAIRQAATWWRAGTWLPVSVNLAAGYLARDRVVPTITALLDIHRLPAELLTVEITESSVMDRPDEVADRLASLRRLGIRVSIDDFGTGYTSLSLLPRLPIDELKIDRSFVGQMLTSSAHHAIVGGVTDMAKRLGLTVVAEGIEDGRTADALRRIGVDLLQGYYFARPAPADALLRRISPMLGGDAFLAA